MALGDVVHYRESDGSESLGLAINEEQEGLRMLVFAVDDVIENSVRTQRGSNVSQRLVICERGYADANTWHSAAECRG